MTISLLEIIQRQFHFVGNENHWHASLNDLINATTPEEAAWQPPNGGHTIYEIVAHLAYSTEIMSARSQGHSEQWDPTKGWVETSAQLTLDEWEQVKDRLHVAKEQLAAALNALCEEELTAANDGNPSLFDHILQIIAHEAFHAGQIAILRRQQGNEALM